ncbi:XAP5, circadian clock regulator-domain-containing protein [Corynascus similis CBS 632.67]
MTGNKRKASDDAAGIRSQPRNERPLGEPTADSESNTLGRSKPGRPSRPVPGVAADGYFRQLYATEPDFRQLARRDPQFAAVLQSNGQLDFSDPAATMQLTKTLLHLDFGLKLDLPEDRLCPPLVSRSADDPLIPVTDMGSGCTIDFVMMNPPFYDSEEDMLSSANKKARPPMSACTGAPVEMVCDGGEVAHVGRLLRESLVLQDRIQWYTAMLGKLTSLETLIEQLRHDGIDNYAVTEFVQGNKTRRWALGWSFGPMRPSEHAARGMKASLWKKILPPSVTAELLVLPVNKSTTHERLSTNTVGLVALSDFRKRRAEVLEQQEREAREAAAALSARTATSTPDRSLTATPTPTNIASGAESSEAERQKKRKKKKHAKALVSFGGDEEEEEEGALGSKIAIDKVAGRKEKEAEKVARSDVGDSSGVEGGVEGVSGDDRDEDKDTGEKSRAKVVVNSSVGIVPRARTKAALRREAAEREALRKEFLMLQAAVKATEIAIPFVFYDGTNIPGGIVRVKKGDFVWLFLDKSRKVGAQLEVGADKSVNARRDWARVSVDDLLLVRGTMIIPHHYEFYYFIINKTIGPGNRLLFDYSSEATPTQTAAATPGITEVGRAPALSELEGASDDPTITKVVDRRWYQRNKHIYPANMWQEFDPEKDYSKEIRRDPGGNAFFFTK